MASTHVYLVEAVPAREVVQHTRLVEVRQLGHVVHSGRRRLRVLGVYAAKACHDLWTKRTYMVKLVIKTCKPIAENSSDIWDWQFQTPSQNIYLYRLLAVVSWFLWVTSNFACKLSFLRSTGDQ